MQPKSNSKTVIIIIVIVLIVGAGIYFYKQGTAATDTSMTSGTLTSDQGADPDIVGGKILVLLNQISNLHIDAKFFTSGVYTSLTDHTVPIYEQGVGKANPFYDPGRKVTPAH